jgi:hypothetical protein
MKKPFLSLLALTSLSVSSFASITIDISIGTAYSTPTATTPFPTSGVFKLLALESGTWGDVATLQSTFSNLTSSFAPIGSSVIASFDGSNNGGNAGLGAFTLSDYTYAGNIGAGDQLLLLGYPTLTTSSGSPGFGTAGFFFRTATVGGDGQPPNISFVLPADGTTSQLWFESEILTSGNGATGGSTGWGGFTTVPEPSTYALMALGGLVLFFIARRRKAQA